MNTTLRKAMGDKIADRCKEVWDLDDEGEINAVSTKDSTYKKTLLLILA
jgi:hypothetical protein